jgi:hypothetical protein
MVSRPRGAPRKCLKQNPGQRVRLYQVLQMWRLGNAVLFICFVLLTVEALSLERSILTSAS